MIDAGVEVLCGIDSSLECCVTYYANLAKKDVEWLGKKPSNFPSFSKIKSRTVKLIICDDIKAIRGKDLLKKLGIPELGILFGGPPCQGFSLAMKGRSIKDPRSRLMWEFIRLVGEIKPKTFLIENVRGLMSFKDFFFLLLESLEAKGYVVRFNLLDAASYGVPQNRRRVFIEGMRKDLNKLPIFPRPTHFSPEHLKHKKNSFSPSEIAFGAFAENGFSKAEIKDVWYNTKLNILMNRKTAAFTLDKAAGFLVGTAIKSQIKRRAR